MNQLRVRYHQLKIDMFALYQATMDSRGVKVHRVEQALGEIQPALPNGDVQLRNEDADYVQTLSEMEKKISVGEHGRRRRHMLRKLNFSRPSGDEAAAAPDVSEPCTSEATPRPETGCRELDRHSNITVLRCYRCTRRFDDKTSLYQHWRDEINCHIVCLFCREEFITNAKHDQHIRLCQALVCAQCKAQCQDYTGYEHHICVCQYAAKCEPVEVLAARVQCPYCDRLFTQIHMFKRHLKMMHEVEHMQRFGLKIQRKFRPNEREFPCRQCGRTFNRVYNLKMHQLSHGRHGQYRCETCNKTFRFRSNLDRHARSHNNQQHVCRVCGRQFRLLRQLRGHMNLVHDKETFSCDVCQKSCEGYQRLLAHTRTHHTQKSYSCGVCGRTFNTKHKYKEHMNVHEGRFMYECHLCSERFFTRDHLRKHYRKQHPEVKRVPRRATTRRPLEPGRQPFFEPADLGPMINDTVTLYQASADSGEASAVKFEVVGEPCEEQADQPYATDRTSQEMMDGGYQVYEGSEQHVLGEYSSVAEGEPYTSAGQCHRPVVHPVQYFQQQVPDGVDGAATLLSLEPAAAGSVSDVPEGATVMTYIVPETSSSQFNVQDNGWSSAGLFNFQPLATPEKSAPGVGSLFTPGKRGGMASGMEAQSLLLTPDKATALAPQSLFMSPEQPTGGAAVSFAPPELTGPHRATTIAQCPVSTAHFDQQMSSPPKYSVQIPSSAALAALSASQAEASGMISSVSQCAASLDPASAVSLGPYRWTCADKGGPDSDFVYHPLTPPDPVKQQRGSSGGDMASASSAGQTQCRQITIEQARQLAAAAAQSASPGRGPYPQITVEEARRLARCPTSCGGPPPPLLRGPSPRCRSPRQSGGPVQLGLSLSDTSGLQSPPTRHRPRPIFTSPQQTPILVSLLSEHPTPKAERD